MLHVLQCYNSGIGEREGRVTRNNIRYARGGWGGVLPPHVGMGCFVLPSRGRCCVLQYRGDGVIQSKSNPPYEGGQGDVFLGHAIVHSGSTMRMLHPPTPFARGILLLPLFLIVRIFGTNLHMGHTFRRIGKHTLTIGTPRSSKNNFVTRVG